MTNCNRESFYFPSNKGKKVEVNFSGGDVTSDGGVLLLREIDRRLGLSKKVAALIPDPRDNRYIEHSIEEMLSQRIYGIALGYEDLNDHTTLRKDPGFQTAINCDTDLASAPTLSRFENNATREMAVEINKIHVEILSTRLKKRQKN